MILQRALRALLKDAAEGAELHTLVNPWASRRKFASFAYIAEQYGYRYIGLAPGIPMGRSHPVFAFRRLPDGPERAARTMTHYPNVAQRGPFPGMKAGGDGLTPLPETRREIELLHARIKVDLFGKSSTKRIKRLLFAIPIGIFIALAVTGNLARTPLLVGAGITLFFFLYLWLAATIMRRGYAKYSRMLEQAGLAWPLDRRGD
ncbi:hypothetical protein [Streptomyces sp. H27-C3]|uniref:hypothetical protein n=1 Tax=Streptomyces sp. H27-C3 TaxID=3046305 RepID=UPI0024B8CFC1|nr:hypothetical protein [Streptomyces sp. H27-C3]MDJ0466640.1 hypothetical protein [Streptomyces sp. H27-C3]